MKIKKYPGLHLPLTRKLIPLLLILVICTSISGTGCSQQNIDEPCLLSSAVEACSGNILVWHEDIIGIDAAIKPDSATYGGHNMILNAVYRSSGADQAKFALFFPQGSKIGQCEKTGSGVNCTTLPFPGSSSLVRTSFAAIDEILLLRPKADDRYELRLGDSRGGIDSSRIVLARQRTSASGKYDIFSSLNGKIISAYKRGISGGGESLPVSITSWKAFFNDNQTTYRFVPQGNNLALDVFITRNLVKQ